MMRLGIVGAGLIGQKRADAVAALPRIMKVAAVCDIYPERAEALARRQGAAVYRDWRDLIGSDAVDAVIVATPNSLLREIALAALGRNKHVLCEKPLGRDAAEAEEICRAAEAGGLVLKTGFNHRFHPAIREARNIVASGDLGNLYYVKATYGHGGRPGYEKEWRACREICGGGELLDQGVHVVDLFRWFLGEFDEVFGRVETYFWDIEVEDNAFALFRTAGGQAAILHTSWTQWKNRFSFEIFGERGYLAVEGLGGSYGPEKLVLGKRRTRRAAGTEYAGGAPEERVIEYGGPDVSWIAELEEFAAAIQTGRQPLGSGHDGLMANRLVGAIYESARRGAPVRLDEGDEHRKSAG
jgi:predicted dehydrogenase